MHWSMSNVPTPPPREERGGIKLVFFFHWMANFRERGRGGVLPYKRLIGMCHWMGSHFHDWIDYNGVAFSIELIEWGRRFSDFWSK